jgi:hypothetical protein
LRPSHVLGDGGFSSKAIRTWLRRSGIAYIIAERAGQIRNRLRRGSQAGDHRPSTGVCASGAPWWNGVSTARHWRRIATRYDRTAETYRATVTLAALRMSA